MKCKHVNKENERCKKYSVKGYGGYCREHSDKACPVVMDGKKCCKIIYQDGLCKFHFDEHNKPLQIQSKQIPELENRGKVVTYWDENKKKPKKFKKRLSYPCIKCGAEKLSFGVLTYAAVNKVSQSPDGKLAYFKCRACKRGFSMPIQK